jgi:hypothetical protein
MGSLSVVVRYLDGAKMTMNGISFNQCIRKVHEDAEKNNRTPLVLTFSTGKKIYYDEEQVQNYVENNIDQLELVEATECDGIYRNTTKMKMENEEELEEGWLWTKKGDYVFLVDKDRSVYCEFDERLFVES